MTACRPSLSTLKYSTSYGDCQRVIQNFGVKLDTIKDVVYIRGVGVRGYDHTNIGGTEMAAATLVLCPDRPEWRLTLPDGQAIYCRSRETLLGLAERMGLDVREP